MIDGMTFLYPELIHLVWAVVALVALLAWMELRGQSALARFLSPVMLIRLSDRPSLSRRIVKLGLILATLVFGVVALMRPQSHGADQSFRCMPQACGSRWQPGYCPTSNSLPIAQRRHRHCGRDPDKG